MKTYIISRKLETITTVRATDYEDAANKAARKLYGRKAVANRTTGNTQMSGYFQAYEPMPRGQRGQNSVGDPFHVSEN